MEIMDVEQKQTIDLEITPLSKRLAYGIKVSNQSERAALVIDVKGAEELKKKIEEKFHPTANKVAAREVYDASLDTEKQFYQPIDNFIAAGKKEVKTFDTNETIRIQREQREAQERQEQKEREEKARREAEARAAQEAEEKRVLEEAQKLEDERQKKLKLQESAMASGDAKVAGLAAREVAKLDNQINEVVQIGQKNIEEIQAKAEEPAPAPLKFTPPPAPTKKLFWKARVTNMMKLCREIGKGNVPFSVVDISQSKLNDFAKSHFSALDTEGFVPKIEGLDFYQETIGRL